MMDGVKCRRQVKKTDKIVFASQSINQSISKFLEWPK